METATRRSFDARSEGSPKGGIAVSDTEPAKEQLEFERKPGRIRNAAAGAAGLAAGGIVERETLADLVQDTDASSGPAPDETSNPFDAYGDLDSTYRPSGEESNGAEDLPELDFGSPENQAETPPATAVVPPVEFTPAVTSTDPFDAVAPVDERLTDLDGDDALDLDWVDDPDPELDL